MTDNSLVQIGISVVSPEERTCKLHIVYNLTHISQNVQYYHRLPILGIRTYSSHFAMQSAHSKRVCFDCFRLDANCDIVIPPVLLKFGRQHMKEKQNI